MGVHYIDYGNCEMVSLDEVYHIPHDVMSIPEQVRTDLSSSMYHTFPCRQSTADFTILPHPLVRPHPLRKLHGLKTHQITSMNWWEVWII